MREAEDIQSWLNEACQKNEMPKLGTEIRVVFSRNMTRCLGMAFAKKKLIKLSEPLWDRANTEEKKQVVIHEACHIVAFIKHAMLNAGVFPKRTHNVNRDGLRRQYIKYEARCSCTPSVWLGHKIASYVRKGTAYCKRCKGSVVFTGNTKRPERAAACDSK
jgi:predicted SprT family Zn-dependent metalloprotease